MEGHWRYSGILYRDDLVRVVVDVPTAPGIAMDETVGRALEARLEQVSCGW